MGFPFLFHENFEAGTKGGFDSESDSGNRLDYPGPQQLQRDMLAVFPHRGAYCARVNLGKNTTDSYVSKTISWALDSTNFMRFEFMVGDDVAAGNDGDLVDIMVISSGSDESAISLARIEPAGLVVGLRDAAGAIMSYLAVDPGDWMCIEAQIDVDAGAGNDGSVILWRGNERIRISNLDQAALTSARFGALNQSGDWTGHIYFDEVVFDDNRLYPDYSPHNLRLDGETMALFKSGWAFVGEGDILGAQLIDGGSGDCKLKVYDTDDVAFSESHLKLQLSTTVANTVAQSQDFGGAYLFKVRQGCYVQLSGTNPSALIRMGRVDELDLDEDFYNPEQAFPPEGEAPAKAAE